MLTKLNPLQRLGLALMSGGLAAYIALALLFPALRVLWLSVWGVSLIGSIVYVWATLKRF